MNVPLRTSLLFGALLVVAGLAGRGTGSPVQPPAVACTVPATAAGLGNLERRPSGRALRIVALGSSSTAGQGASRPSLGYVAQLQAMLQRSWGAARVEVLNRGVGGDTLGMEMARSARDVYALRPDLVLLQTGTNDAMKGVPPEVFRRQLDGFVRDLRGRGLAVLLIDNQYLPQQVDAPEYQGVLAAMRSVAREQGVTLVSRFALGQRLTDAGWRPDDLLAADHFHPNDFMHWCTAQAIASTLEAAVE